MSWWPALRRWHIEKPADHRHQPPAARRYQHVISAGEHGELCVRKETKGIHGIFGADDVSVADHHREKGTAKRGQIYFRISVVQSQAGFG